MRTRVTQFVAEVAHGGTSEAWVTQVVAEVVENASDTQAFMTQVVAEVVENYIDTQALVTQFVVEVLVPKTRFVPQIIRYR